MRTFCLFLVGTFCFLCLGVLSAFGQRAGFAMELKEDMERVGREAGKDPDTFDDNMSGLEKKWGERRNPVEQSVVNALFGSAYMGARWSHTVAYDEEKLNVYKTKAKEHFAHVLDDVDALADASSSSYAPLMSRGKDSEMYGNDMLSVMVDFLIQESRMNSEDMVPWVEKAMEKYRRSANLNGYGLMKMRWLELLCGVEKRLGGLTNQQYEDSLSALLQEVKREEVGADVAWRYCMSLGDQDGKILFLKQIQKELGNSRRRVTLNRELERLLVPRVDVKKADALLANRPCEVDLEFWNTRTSVVTVRKYAGKRQTKRGWELVATGAVVERKNATLPDDSFQQSRVAQGLPVKGVGSLELSLPVGHYVMVAEAAGQRTVSEFRVGTLRMVCMAISKERRRIWVVDAETGRPQQGVKVQWCKELPSYSRRTEGWENRSAEGELVTGADGTVDVEERMAYVRAVKNGEDYTDWMNIRRGGFGRSQERNDIPHVRIMTDRSVYRPGQVVKGSALMYRQQGDILEVASDSVIELTIRDDKGNEFDKKTLKTNEYGTASFEIVLPEDCEVGRVVLDARNGNNKFYGMTSVRVEEYKRPTFDVTFGGNRAGRFGETLHAEGKAEMLAGVPVQGAQVRYRISYSSGSVNWWRYVNWVELDDGELTTDEEGRFDVPVALSNEYLNPGDEVLRIRVNATVTDTNGESHEAEWVATVSRREFYLTIETAEVADKMERPHFKVSAWDLNHKKVEKRGQYVIRADEQVVEKGTFVSGDSIAFPEGLVPGVNYHVCVTAVETDGKEVEEQRMVTFYDSSLPVTSVSRWGVGEKLRPEHLKPMQNFFYAKTDTFHVNEPIDLYLSTEHTDAYIIYNVYNAQGLIDQQVGVTDGTMQHLRLPYRADWGEGIRVTAVYVRNGEYVQMAKTFVLAAPEKQLKLEWQTFRDKLQPGQQEQWTLTVSKKDGQRVSGAETMAVLYDASLDLIYPHRWAMDVSFSRVTPWTNAFCSNATAFPYFSLSGRVGYGQGYDRTFDRLKGYEVVRFGRSTGQSLKEVAAPQLMNTAGVDAALSGRVAGLSFSMQKMRSTADFAEAEDGLAEETVMEDAESAVSAEEDIERVDVRTNFEETAFFLPHVVSDSEGNVQMSFMLPESLTEWNFMGLAHTKDMDYGSIQAKVVARKDFMVRPNMPRFVRWDDKVVLAASVVNQGDADLKGKVRMQLLDAITEKVLLTQEVPFEVEKGKTTGVDFRFDVKREWTDVDCVMVAVSGNASDGERNRLPVLTTMREMVETVPYYVRGDGSTEIVDLSGLFNRNSSTAVQREMKVEYVDNPAWMCVEALRGVKVPEEDDAIGFATALYANTRLVDLMRTFPLVEKYEKADELRNLAASVEERLAKLQNDDGGWSWFKGMNSSYYTTLAVCGHLAKMPNPDSRVKAMLDKGMAYLDQNELKSYNLAKKKEKGAQPSENTLRYLYVWAQMPGRNVSRELERMREDYLTKSAKDVRDLTIYGAANAAYTLRAFGHVKESERIVNFLKDYLVEKPGLGKFFATDAAYYSWTDYRIPTQVAAMKAIRQHDKDDACLNDMQLWLIAQKQVQKWDSPLNTIDVVDLLLQVSPMETLREAKKPVLKLDGKVLEQMDYGTINTERDALEGREANLVLEGNVVADVPQAMLGKGPKRLEVVKQTPGISWGAAYATFLEDMDKVNPYATNELKIERKFYVQRGDGKWEELDGKKPLKVGDKLRIRHIVAADRDMDFVRVTAQHPACLEPQRQLSGYQWMGARGGYLSVRDSNCSMFFDWLTRGTTTVDVEYFVSRAGTYQVGVSTVECAYAKQFGAHTDSAKIKVEK